MQSIASVLAYVNVPLRGSTPPFGGIIKDTNLGLSRATGFTGSLHDPDTGRFPAQAFMGAAGHDFFVPPRATGQKCGENDWLIPAGSPFRSKPLACAPQAAHV